MSAVGHPRAPVSHDQRVDPAPLPPPLQQFDVPEEQKIVVNKMVEAVNQLDPDFFKFIEEEMPLEETLEYQLMQTLTRACVAAGRRRSIRNLTGN